MPDQRANTVKLTKPRTKPRTPAAAPASRDAAKPAESAPPAQPASNKLSVQQPPDRSAGDSRLPATGAHLVRTVGKKRCECVVEEEGFRYGGRLHRSLSAAAAAAARDCGLNPAQNGFVFWRLSSAARSPLDVVAHRWGRYTQALERSLTTRAAERARREALQHLDALKEFLRGASEATQQWGRPASRTQAGAPSMPATTTPSA